LYNLLYKQYVCGVMPDEDNKISVKAEVTAINTSKDNAAEYNNVINPILSAIKEAKTKIEKEDPKGKHTKVAKLDTALKTLGGVVTATSLAADKIALYHKSIGAADESDPVVMQFQLQMHKTYVGTDTLTVKPKKSSGKKSLFNVASGITKNATVAILDYVEKSADKTKKEISENIAKVIPEHKYSDYITKKDGEEMNARLDRLTKKLATVVGKLSAPVESAKGYEHVGNRKLMSKAGKYSIYNTAMRKSGSAI